MRKSIFIFLELLAGIAFAQEYRSIDIINNSDMPITLTYSECQIDYTGTEFSSLYNCTEKTSDLAAKGNGKNFINYGNRKENNQNPNIWILKKIVSPLGEQNYISFVSMDERDQKTESDFGKNVDKFCYAWIEDKVKTNGYARTIVFDNLGTNKFYCHHLWMEG